jgi:hypothetical protein
MEAAALQVTDSIFPESHVIDALTAKFNASPERAALGDVKPKQVNNGVDVPRIYGLATSNFSSHELRTGRMQLATWFRNRRYAPRSKLLKPRRKTNLQRASSSRQAGASVGPGHNLISPLSRKKKILSHLDLLLYSSSVLETFH